MIKDGIVVKAVKDKVNNVPNNPQEGGEKEWFVCEFSLHKQEIHCSLEA